MKAWVLRFWSGAFGLSILAGCASSGSDGPLADPATSSISMSEVRKGTLVPDREAPPAIPADRIGAVDSAIERLASRSFGEYCRAATELLEIGEPALPFLVLHESDRRVDFGVPSSCVTPVIHRVLGELASERLVAYVTSPQMVLRLSAIRHLGDRQEAGAVPHLLATFPSESGSLRDRYFESLQAITGIPEHRPPSWEEGARGLFARWQNWWFEKDIALPRFLVEF